MPTVAQLLLILLVPGGLLFGAAWLARKIFQQDSQPGPEISFSAELSRKVFNKLHLELSLLVGTNLSRMELWHSVASMKGLNPATLTGAQAAQYCYWEARPWLRSQNFEPAAFELDAVAQCLLDYNPKQSTPEEILERLCGDQDE